MILRKIAYLPKLNDCRGDLSKKWFVYFSYRNPQSGRMDRFKDYDGFGVLKTKKLRYEYAQKRIFYYKRKLRMGWNPFEDDKVLYSSGEQHVVLKHKSSISIEQHLTKTMLLLTKSDRPKTYSDYKLHIKYFIDFLTERKMVDQDISLITEGLAEDFALWIVGNKKLSNKTHNHVLFLLRRLFSTLVRKKVCDFNPFQYIQNKKHYGRSRPYYPDQLRFALLDAIEKGDPELYFFIQLTYYTMRRKTELLKLRIKDIHIEQAVLTFQGKDAKTGVLQMVDIPQQLYDILVRMKLHQFPEDFYLLGTYGLPGAKSAGKNYYYKRWVKFREDFGLTSRYGIYSWKHTAAVTMKTAGFDLKDIQDHAGWSSLEMVENYMKSFSISGSKKIRQQFPDIRSRTATVALSQSLLLEQPFDQGIVVP